jgi:cytochrome P450
MDDGRCRTLDDPIMRLGAQMTVDTATPNIFEAGLPTLTYDVTESPREVYPRIRDAQQRAPIAIGPLGPEVLGYDLARTVLRDTRFVIPPGLHLTAQGVTSGPLWDRVVGSIMCAEGAEHQRLRSLVSKAFTPRATARLHDVISSVVNELADHVADTGRCDIVTDIARPYPGRWRRSNRWLNSWLPARTWSGPRWSG